ncbi:hypothetical protein N6H14_28285 [Paenibacillus sp. CC-CFT747]|nr:hypothetical protein N6H14_28285 [Paenibacillus sp. CC-CFT747]
MNRPYFRMTGKTQDAEQKWPGFSAMGLDHEDILVAMAPRPVLVLATTYDSVPIEAPRQVVESCRRFWTLHGRGEQLQLFEDADVHRFTIPLVRAAVAFLPGTFSEKLLFLLTGRFICWSRRNFGARGAGRLSGNGKGHTVYGTRTGNGCPKRQS